MSDTGDYGYESPLEIFRRREEDRIAALRAEGKMRRVRVISDGQVLGSIEWPNGYVGGQLAHFRIGRTRLADGAMVAFDFALYQVDENRTPVASVDRREDAGYFTLEVFLDVPAGWVDRLPEFPGWEALRQRRIIDLGPASL